MDFPGGAVVKNLPVSAADASNVGLIPGLGRYPGEGNGNHSSILGNGQWSLVGYTTVHGISQAKILEWVATSCSKRSSWPRDRTRISSISCTDRQILYHCATQEAHHEETDNLRRNQGGILGLKYNTWSKKFSRGIYGKFEQAERKISEPKCRMGEVIESEQQKEKRVKKNEQSLKGLCDIMKRITHAVGLSEGEER